MMRTGITIARGQRYRLRARFPARFGAARRLLATERTGISTYVLPIFFGTPMTRRPFTVAAVGIPLRARLANSFCTPVRKAASAFRAVALTGALGSTMTVVRVLPRDRFGCFACMFE
jgi:hypothetical protein